MASGAAELWLDLTDTASMDPSGLHLMLETRRRMRRLNRRLAIICPDGVVRRVFEIDRLTEQLAVYESRAAAHHGG